MQPKRTQRSLTSTPMSTLLGSTLLSAHAGQLQPVGSSHADSGSQSSRHAQPSMLRRASQPYHSRSCQLAERPAGAANFVQVAAQHSHLGNSTASTTPVTICAMHICRRSRSSRHSRRSIEERGVHAAWIVNGRNSRSIEERGVHAAWIVNGRNSRSSRGLAWMPPSMNKNLRPNLSTAAFPMEGQVNATCVRAIRHCPSSHQ